MRLRRASSLAITFEHDKLVLINFLRRVSFSCNVLCLGMLAEADAWTDIDRFFDKYSVYTRASVAESLLQLIKLTGLIVEGSPEATLDDEYNKSWHWGPVAGLYHFAIKDARFLTLEETERELTERAQVLPIPP